MKLEIAASAGNFGGVSPTIGRLRQLLTYHGKFLCKFGTGGSMPLSRQHEPLLCT